MEAILHSFSISTVYPSQKPASVLKELDLVEYMPTVTSFFIYTFYFKLILMDCLTSMDKIVGYFQLVFQSLSNSYKDKIIIIFSLDCYYFPDEFSLIVLLSSGPLFFCDHLVLQ